MTRPIAANIPVSFAYLKKYSNGTIHKGVDFSDGKEGHQLFAPIAGKVIHAGMNNSTGEGPAYGNHLIIQATFGGKTKFVLLGHMKSITVKVGQVLKAGDKVGLSGGKKGAAYSGNSTGPHVHVQVNSKNNYTTYEDPWPIIDAADAAPLAVWGKPETFVIGATGPDVTRLGERLVLHLKALGKPSPYKVGPGSPLGSADIAGVKAFQIAQGWTGGDADGYPGMQTFALLESDPVASTPDPTPAVTKPALRAARAAGAAPAKIPSSMSKMYHVASNVWYAVEDSLPGLEAAEAFGYPWADIDIHVTKDGVPVCGHDTSPSDDHFVISAAMKKKYGSHPNIENMTWADVATLRTPPTKFRGATITLRYYKVDEILAWMGEHPKVSVSFELKQSKAFENPKTFEDLRDRAIEHDVDPKRLAIMSIARPAYDHLARFKAAHPYFPTMVLPHDLAKPKNWASVQPYVDYYRGSWAK